MTATLLQFLDDPRLTRTHVREGNLEVYLRKSSRSLGGRVTYTLTVADMQTLDFTEVPRAAFEAWFNVAEVAARDHGLSFAFENVSYWKWMNEFLALRHFTRSDDQSIHPSQLDAYRLHRTSLE